MLGKGHELGDRSQLLVQTIELVAAATGTRDQSGVPVQGTVNATVIGKVHHDLRVVVLKEVQGVLIGLNMRNRAKVGRASEGVGEIDERVGRVAIAAGGRAGDSAFE